MQKHSLTPQRGFFPQPSYLIGTFKDDAAPNFTLITFITFCSINPPMLMFASRGKNLYVILLRKIKFFLQTLLPPE